MPGSPAQEVSYAITRSHLLVNVGRIALLQEVLASMQAGGPGFWQLPEVEEMFRSIGRPNAVTRSYFDLSQSVGPALQSLTTYMSMAGSSQGQSPEVPGGLDFPYDLISEMNETEEAFFSRSLLVPKEAVE